MGTTVSAPQFPFSCSLALRLLYPTTLNANVVLSSVARWLGTVLGERWRVFSNSGELEGRLERGCPYDVQEWNHVVCISNFLRNLLALQTKGRSCTHSPLVASAFSHQ